MGWAGVSRLGTPKECCRADEAVAVSGGSTDLFVVAIALALIGTVVLVVQAVQMAAFTFTFRGLAGLALEGTAEDVSSTYSVMSMAQVRAAETLLSEGSDRAGLGRD